MPYLQSLVRSLVALAALAACCVAAPAVAKSSVVPPTTLEAIQAQTLLDKIGYSPGQIDGKWGRNAQGAADAFLLSYNASAPDYPSLVKALRKVARTDALTSYTIRDADTTGLVKEGIPSDMAGKAKLKYLGYGSVLEALGEKFHVQPELLQKLNPNVKFAARQVITVPNVVTMPRTTDRPTAEAVLARADVVVTVSKSRSAMSVFDAEGYLIFYSPVTSGSEHDPLPFGNWRVTSIEYNPVYHYNPQLFWDANPADQEAELPAGPNNPVGVVWVNLSKDHFGLHGTPEPSTIGYAASHGCVRLPNWEVLRLASLVKPGTRVIFGP